MNSLSEADWLSEPHPLSEATSSLSGCKTLEEDKLEICMFSVQPARPVRMLSIIAPTLTKQKSTNSRLASLQKLKSPRAFKNTEVGGVKKRTG